MIINISDIHFFSPTERKDLENLTIIIDYNNKWQSIENNPDNFKPKSFNFSDQNL